MTAYGGLPPNTPASSETPGYYTPRPQISFDVFTEAFNLFKLQMGAWVGAVFVFFVIIMGIAMLGGTVMIGSLVASGGSRGAAGAGIFLFFATYAGLIFVVTLASMFLMGGLMRMALKQVRGETIGISDMFSVTDVIGPLIGTALLVTIIGSIGSLFFVIPGLIASGLMMFALPLVVDQRLGPIEAITKSFDMLKNDWLMASLFFFAAGLVAGVGGLLCGVGALFTYPIYFLVIVLTYRNYTTGGAPPTVPGSYPPVVPGGYTPQTGTPLSGSYTPTTPTMGDNNHPTLNSQNQEPPKL